MKCPACNNPLTQIDNGVIVVDACAGHCGGIWFDNFELKKVDEQHEEAGDLFLDVTIDPNLKVNMQRRRQCPVCENITMMRHPFSARRAIEVDECGKCGGIWLDAHELGRIRGEFVNEAARVQAATDEFAQTFDAELARMRQQSEEEVKRANKFASMFKAILPSTYIPGMQGGQSEKHSGAVKRVDH